MSFSVLCSPRILEERKRLGLNQDQAADECGVTRGMWGKYERGLAVPGGEVLFAFSAIGADIRYIVSGERDGPPPISLTADEQVLLDGYRALDAANKRRMLGFVLGGEAPASKSVTQVIHGNAGQVNQGDISNTAPIIVGGREPRQK